MSDQIRLLLADDHAVVRSGLRMLLEAQPDMTIIGEADAIEQAVRRKTDRASGLIERWEAGHSAT